MAGEQEIKKEIKNKNKVQKIIFIVNAMRTINPHTLTKAYHQFSNKRGPYRLYISVG